MAGRRYQRAVAGVVLALTAACSRDDRRAVPTATVPTQVTTTTTTGPYAVPAVIDEAYVNRVLAELDAVIGDVVRIVVRERQLTPEAMDRLKAVYAEEMLPLVTESLDRDLRDGLKAYRPAPGNKRTTVVRLISARQECVFVMVERDYSSVAQAAQALNPQWIALRPTSQSSTQSTYNRTGWIYVYEGFPPDRSEPPDPCAADLS